MARVTKTSGQGVSRKGYQTAYRAAHQPDAVSIKAASALAPTAGRTYGKASYEPPKGAMAIDYEPAIFGVSTLKETEGAFKDAPKSSPQSSPLNKMLPPRKLK